MTDYRLELDPDTDKTAAEFEHDLLWVIRRLDEEIRATGTRRYMNPLRTDHVAKLLEALRYRRMKALRYRRMIQLTCRPCDVNFESNAETPVCPQCGTYKVLLADLETGAEVTA